MGVSVQLPAYSPARPCPKCSAEEIATIFHPGPLLTLDRVWPCAAQPRTQVEHLCRVCTGCGFAWCEAVSDAYPEQEAQPEEAS